MNLKKTLLFSAAISTVTIAAIVSLGYLNASQASKINPLAIDTIAQVLPEDMSERAAAQLYARTGKAIYVPENPAIQFVYDPNFFVLESFETASETVQSVMK